MPGGKTAKQKGGKGNKNKKRGKDEDGGLGDVDLFDQRFDREEWLKKNAVHLNYDAINRDDYDDDDLQ
eukprot:CAMPEP_0197040030 /NCGR_PEP_ID=MMETSP1384-20130603/16786_1 /TAXON_ID=29189 /ORGANISM="Ammonia sp." /LENGTH=67 /DNA_ID=CAMNT_0042470715 /DNA_START=76 /DNA_END=279 /DNA_ORIENTATION=-